MFRWGAALPWAGSRSISTPPTRRQSGDPWGTAIAQMTDRLNMASIARVLIYLGARSVDLIDASDYEGATIVHDLNKPLPAGWSTKFDTVIDFGTIEHVFDVPQVLRTYASLVSEGGSIVIATQADGSCGHGLYQFSPELFYRFFSTKNGFETKCFLIPCGSSRRAWIFSPDPAASNSRIEFPVMGKTYVVAVSTRRGPLGAFDDVQQSDYTALWHQNTVTFYKRPRLPEQMRALTQPIYASLKKRLRDTAVGHWAERVPEAQPASN